MKYSSWTTKNANPLMALLIVLVHNSRTVYNLPVDSDTHTIHFKSRIRDPLLDSPT